MDFSIKYVVRYSGEIVVSAENKEIARQSVLEDIEDEPFIEEAKKCVRTVKKIVPAKVAFNG